MVFFSWSLSSCNDICKGHTFCSDTLHVHTDPDSSLRFAEGCSFLELVIGLIPLRAKKATVCERPLVSLS